MSDPIISVEKLSKVYRLNHESKRSDSFRELLTNTALAPFRKFRELGGGTSGTEEFWALRNVSFEVNRGDVVGIIGRNGAGKSTLLKVLSRIVEPTSGRAVLRGRVASLLEVGTGFHPELTGRENIYMNGSILGMKRHEISAKFDEIVAFSEVEKFLDTPVKRYSSGMYVRLAFAVAAHMDPEILIVDEVLAVGDAEFQKKCLGKMKEVASGTGRTVLFVSHNMAAVRSLCSRCVLLSGGSVALDDTSEAAITRYLHNPIKLDTPNSRSTAGLRLVSAEIASSSSGAVSSSILFNDASVFRFSITAETSFSNAAIVARIYTSGGTLISTMCTVEEGVNPFELSKTAKIMFFVPRMVLMPGSYTVDLFVYRPNDSVEYLRAESAITFDVIAQNVRDGMWAYQSHHGVARCTDGCNVTFE